MLLLKRLRMPVARVMEMGHWPSCLAPWYAVWRFGLACTVPSHSFAWAKLNRLPPRSSCRLQTSYDCGLFFPDPLFGLMLVTPGPRPMPKPPGNTSTLQDCFAYFQSVQVRAGLHEAFGAGWDCQHICSKRTIVPGWL